MWRDAVAAPEWTGPRVWLHADLHSANVLTAGGTFCGRPGGLPRGRRLLDVLRRHGRTIVTEIRVGAHLPARSHSLRPTADCFGGGA
ncbi:MAG: hypothetical protein ACRDQV_03340 [Pseudonocardiaceae bacterium]